MMISENTCRVTEDYEALEQEEIFQMMAGTVPSQDEALIAGTKSVKVARWWDRAVDIIPRNSGKAVAMEKILKYYGFSVEESMAFGDGGNDLDMIQYAGIGVAMGNAVEEVKPAADMIADSCDRDGVFRTLQQIGLI